MKTDNGGHLYPYRGVWDWDSAQVNYSAGAVTTRVTLVLVISTHYHHEQYRCATVTAYREGEIHDECVS